MCKGRKRRRRRRTRTRTRRRGRKKKRKTKGLEWREVEGSRGRRRGEKN